jgi:hypothetical protein
MFNPNQFHTEFDSFNKELFSFEKAELIIERAIACGFEAKHRVEGYGVLTLVDYDNAWHYKLTVGVSSATVENFGYFDIDGDEYGFEYTAKSTTEANEIKSKIEALNKQYDHYTEYIDNGAQYHNAMRRNEQIVKEIGELKRRL